MHATHACSNSDISRPDCHGGSPSLRLVDLEPCTQQMAARQFNKSVPPSSYVPCVAMSAPIIRVRSSWLAASQCLSQNLALGESCPAVSLGILLDVNCSLLVRLRLFLTWAESKSFCFGRPQNFSVSHLITVSIALGVRRSSPRYSHSKRPNAANAVQSTQSLPNPARCRGVCFSDASIFCVPRPPFPSADPTYLLFFPHATKPRNPSVRHQSLLSTTHHQQRPPSWRLAPTKARRTPSSSI